MCNLMEYHKKEKPKNYCSNYTFLTKLDKYAIIQKTK